jgi:ABC-2 type transport system permease protein
MKIKRILSLMLRHFYLIKASLPRIIDLIYWPTVQIILWGFVSKFFTMHSSYFNNTAGIILSAAILYDFLFRSSISYNMLFLEEIWSRNLINLFVSPLKVSEIVIALTCTALLRTLIGLVPAVLIAIPLFGISLLELGYPLILLLLSLYIFGITLGLLVTSGLVRFGPSFENIAWASLFFIAPIGCIYYPVEILPTWLQPIALALPLAHIFEETRSILINHTINYSNIYYALVLNVVYLGVALLTFYQSFKSAKVKGSLINVGE